MTKPTPNELQIMLNDMKQRSEERHDEYRQHDNEIMQMLKEIKEQTLKTNGRVNKHDWYFKAMWWALGAIWTVTLIGIPLLYNLFTWSLDVKLKYASQQVVSLLEEKYDLKVNE